MGRIKQPLSSHWSAIWGIIGVIILCGLYEWISIRQHEYNESDTTIPSFKQLVDGMRQVTTPKENSLKLAFGVDDTETSGFWDQVGKTWLFKDASATYSRLIKGLVIGCIISIFLGILMGCYEWIASFFLPTISFLAKVPGTAVLAIFFVLVGTGETMFVTMISFGVMPTLTQAIYLSAKHDVHDEEVNKAYTLGASHAEVIWHVVFQQTLPKTLESVRLQIGPAMVYLIAAEMLVGQVGMGYQIRMQGRLLNMSIVYDYIIILGLTGLLLDRLMLALRRRLCPWFSRYR